MNPRGFGVFGVDAVVADERVGHADHLAILGGIGQNFLISGHGGVKDDFARGFTGAGKGLAGEDRSVFEGQNRFHVCCSPCMS